MRHRTWVNGAGRIAGLEYLAVAGRTTTERGGASMKDDYDARERWRRRRNIALLVIVAFVIVILVAMLQYDRMGFTRYD